MALFIFFDNVIKYFGRNRNWINTMISTIVQCRISVRKTPHFIWRQIQIEDSTDLNTLHRIIGILFDWPADSDHLFYVAGEIFSTASVILDNNREEVQEESAVVLYQLLDAKIHRIGYICDLMKCWEHDILFEKQVKAVSGKHCPICIEGVGVTSHLDKGLCDAGKTSVTPFQNRCDLNAINVKLSQLHTVYA